MAACGPVGDFAAQIDYFGDFRVLFDYFFPGVIPGGPVDVPAQVRASWTSTYVPAVLAALQADLPATAAAPRRRRRARAIRVDPADGRHHGS